MAEDDKDHRDHHDEDYVHLYHNPVERFGQLPEDTRQWLENLRADDLADLKDAVKFYHATAAGGKFVKWLAYAVVAIFVGSAALGHAFQDLWGWIFKTGHT